MAGQLPRLQGWEQWTALEEIESELDNIRVAWEWLLAQEELKTAVEEMLPGLHRFATVRLRQADAESLVQAALDKVRPVGGDQASVTYLILQTVLIDLFILPIMHPPFIYPGGQALLQALWPQAIANQREMGDWFYFFLRHHIFNVGEEATFQQWENYNTVLRAQGNAWRWAQSLKLFSITLLITGRGTDRLIDYLSEALQVFRQQGDEFETAIALFFIAIVADWTGDHKCALENMQQAQQLLAGKGAPVNRGRIIHEMFQVYLHLGRLREALVQMDNPAVMGFLVWPITALAELRAAEKNYTASALLAAYVCQHPLSWLEMRNLAKGLLQEIGPHIDPDFEVPTAAVMAAETLIPALAFKHLPPLD